MYYVVISCNLCNAAFQLAGTKGREAIASLPVSHGPF